MRLFTGLDLPVGTRSSSCVGEHLLTTCVQESSVDLQATAFRLLRQLCVSRRPVERLKPRIAGQRRRAQKTAIDHLTESHHGSLPLVDTCQVAGNVEKSFGVWVNQRLQLRDRPETFREVALQISPQG